MRDYLLNRPTCNNESTRSDAARPVTSAHSQWLPRDLVQVHMNALLPEWLQGISSYCFEVWLSMLALCWGVRPFRSSMLTAAGNSFASRSAASA